MIFFLRFLIMNFENQCCSLPSKELLFVVTAAKETRAMNVPKRAGTAVRAQPWADGHANGTVMDAINWHFGSRLPLEGLARPATPHNSSPIAFLQRSLWILFPSCEVGVGRSLWFQTDSGISVGRWTLAAFGAEGYGARGQKRGSAGVSAPRALAKTGGRGAGTPRGLLPLGAWRGVAGFDVVEFHLRREGNRACIWTTPWGTVLGKVVISGSARVDCLTLYGDFASKNLFVAAFFRYFCPPLRNSFVCFFFNLSLLNEELKAGLAGEDCVFPWFPQDEGGEYWLLFLFLLFWELGLFLEFVFQIVG